MKRTMLLTLFTLAVNLLFSQPFTEQTGISLEGVSDGSVAWGDYDNDGDLDILLTGNSSSGPTSKIYKNNGNNTFTEQTGISLTGVKGGSVVWGDYDNDGYLDVLLTGYMGSTYVSVIYRNNGNNTFTYNSSLKPAELSSVAWADYNNDGYLDILLTGQQGIPNYFSKIYKNNGNSTFSEQTGISLTGVSWSSVAWGDYDNDGDLDILLNGKAGSSNYISKIYKNNGNNTFTEQTDISLTGVYDGSVAWGDYDNDGYLDILLTGQTDTNPISIIYKNNGNNTFSEQTGISLTGVSGGSAAWGDCDNDGDLDILLTGKTGSSDNISKIYINNGNNTFTEQTGISITGVYKSSVAWGDYDNDGDLDILITGEKGSSYISKIYTNENSIVNTIPKITAVSLPIINKNNVTLGWGKATDAQTPSNGLTYNLNIKRVSDGYIAFSSMADVSTGFHRLVQCGNMNHVLTYTVQNIDCGEYEWSVQAIDHCYSGSLFSKGTNFKTPPLPPTMLTPKINSVSEISLSWVDNSRYETGYVVERSVGNNQNFSPVASLNSNSTTYSDNGLTPGIVYYYRVKALYYDLSSDFSNEVNVTTLFIEQPEISLTGFGDGSVAWGDYDNDGDLDILTTGNKRYTTGISKIYKNNGNNIFTEQTGISLTGVYYSSVAWGDYDNDGDLDILLTGSLGATRISKIYKNNGDNTFTDQTGIWLTGVEKGSVAWGDYDNDGDLDILLTGETNSSNRTSKIYRNNGNNTFTEQTGISLTGVSSSSVTWGDYDNDGDLDILLTGYAGSSNYISKIYKNNGNNTFTEQTGISLDGVSSSSVAWGDYDNDGDLDILLTGHTGTTRISKIYKNNGNSTFSEQTGISLTGISQGSVAWGDYDNDGDLDILLSGDIGSSACISKIYRNNGNNTFSDQTEILLPAVYRSTVSWMDYDNDGDLDLILTGWPESGESIAKIYKNYSSISNTFPLPPINLTQTVDKNNATFTWNRATDKETPQNGLSYNLIIQSNEGKIIKSPLADFSTGIRRVVEIGNIGQKDSWTINNLQNGIYTWGVQAIDHNYAGSKFATSGTFIVDLPFKPQKPTGSNNLCIGSTNSVYTTTNIPNATSYIWSLSPFDAGTINGTSTSASVVWSNTFFGTAKIAVKGYNNNGSGQTSDTLAVTFNNKPLAAESIIGTSSICQGSSNQMYTAPKINGASNYVWSLPTGASGTSTTNSITVNFDKTFISGNITVKGKNDCGEGQESSLNIKVNPLPVSAGAILGDTVVCQGVTDRIYTIPEIDDASSYIWSLPIGAIGTSTTNSISVNFDKTFISGNISVKGINDCGESQESSLNIVVNPLPVSAGFILGDTVVCQGVNDQIYAVPEIDNASSYIWSLPTGASGLSITNSISVDYSISAISGDIKVKGENVCGSGTESILLVKVNEKPAKPVVTKNSNEMQSSATSGNQWYKQSELIPGADQKQFTSTGDGQYYVIVTESGCSSEPSDVFTVTGIETIKLKGLVEVYPNPVSQNLSIISVDNGTTIDYEFVNMIGKVIQKGSFIGKTVIETGSFNPGVYLLKIDNGKTNEILKISKE